MHIDACYCVWQDIISKRKITRAEMDALNPGVDLDRLTPNQVPHDTIADRTPVRSTNDMIIICVSSSACCGTSRVPICRGSDHTGLPASWARP